MGFVKMGDSIEDGNGSASEPLLVESAPSRGFFGNLFDLDQYTVYKGCDISTLGAWRSRVFALNTVRRFRNVADLKQRKERQASIEVKPFALSVHFLIQTDEHFDATETTAPKFTELLGQTQVLCVSLRHATASENAAIFTKTR